jgi:hypothetical protein
MSSTFYPAKASRKSARINPAIAAVIPCEINA